MGETAPARPGGREQGSAYRPDIDGLRAVAVLAVLVFHLHAVPLRSAFVGVDIFFVISGYLIGAHVITGVRAGRFSLADFYLRRARRILPALMAMLLAVTALACWLLNPFPLERFGKSLAAASLSGANYWFWIDTDYFAPPAQGAPLLHTWSLGVEEQYYLLFPAFVLLLHRVFAARLGLAIAVATALLFALAVAETQRDAVLAFYSLHTRMWELLLGTAILFPRWAWLEKRWLREATVAGGGLLLLGSMRLLGEEVPFPGLGAVPVCLGAAMVIAAGARGPTIGGRLLSVPPLRFVGLISYSLYLWHWPLILFWKTYKPITELGATDKIGLAVAAVAAATLSWRFIEQPLRRPRWPARRTTFVAAGTMLSIAAVGLALAMGNGWPSRFTPAELAIMAVRQERSAPRDPACFPQDRTAFEGFDAARCLARDARRPNVLLLGDSHGNHLWQGLNRYGGANVMELAISGCHPLIESTRTGKPACRGGMTYAFDWIAREPPDLVLLASRWTKADLDAVDETLRWLKARGVPVVVAGPVPEYDAPLPDLLALALRRGDPGLPARHLVGRIAPLDRALAERVGRAGVPYLSLYKAFCPEVGRCAARAPDGGIVQHDYGHLTTAGSDFVVGRVLAGRPLIALVRPVDNASASVHLPPR